MHNDAINQELTDRGLMPAGEAGPEARHFIETATAPARQPDKKNCFPWKYVAMLRFLFRPA